MSTNKKIIDALNVFGYPIVPDLYNGKENRYFTFNYRDDRAKKFANDESLLTVNYMQIHFFMPISENHLKIKKGIRRSLLQAGFTYPSVTVLTEPENNIKHIVFECEIEESEE